MSKNNYVKPGTYIQYGNKSNIPLTDTRIMLPVVVGRGSPFVKYSESIIRGFISKEEVVVSSIYPNTFSTKYPMLNNIKVYANDEELPKTSWNCLDERTVQLKEYLPNVSYYIDYVSADDSVDDVVTGDIIEVLSVGAMNGSNDFIENKDFYLKYKLGNQKLNNVPTDIIDFLPAYSSTYVNPTIINYKGTDNIQVTVEESPIEILKVTGEIIRIEYDIDSNLSYVLLELNINGLKEHLKINNDHKTYYFNGIGFKLIGTDLHSHLVTKSNVFVRDDGEQDSISFEVIPKMEIVNGPMRTISINVLDKGTRSFTKDIQNVNTRLSGNYDIDITNAINKTTHVTIKSAEIVYIDDGYYINFELVSNDVSLYKLVPIKIDGNKITLLDNVSFETNEKIKINIYNEGLCYLLTEDGLYVIRDEQDNNLLVKSGEKLYLNINETLLDFDYICENTSSPSILTITDSLTNKNDRLEISDDEYHTYKNIQLKFNSDLETGDLIQFDVENGKLISWNLHENHEETFNEFLTDYSGDIFGVYCSKYIKLKYVPENDIAIKGIADFEYELVIKNNEAYVSFTRNSIPYAPEQVTIQYTSKSNKPKLGNTYYITSMCIRPDSMYNSLIKIGSYEEGKELIGPFDNKNDLYIANEIAWRELTTEDSYGYVQIKDSDGDGTITEDDIKLALSCLSRAKNGTDIVLLNQFKGIDYLIDYNENQNDPFESNENKIWIGFPKEFKVNDICEYANKCKERSLPNFKVAVSNNNALITFETDNLPLTKQVDGSFIAWSIACTRRSSRLGFATSLLKKQIYSFDSISTYKDDELLKFGSQNISYIEYENNRYLIREDLTLGDSIEQIIDQQIYVSKYIRTKLNKELIGVTYDNKVDAILLIQSKLILNLRELISKGIISKYLTKDGVGRELDASKDIYVEPIKNNPNQFKFGYGFYTKKGIKYLFGSYILDTRG